MSSRLQVESLTVFTAVVHRLIRVAAARAQHPIGGSDLGGSGTDASWTFRILHDLGFALDIHFSTATRSFRDMVVTRSSAVLVCLMVAKRFS